MQLALHSSQALLHRLVLFFGCLFCWDVLFSVASFIYYFFSRALSFPATIRLESRTLFSNVALRNSIDEFFDSQVVASTAMQTQSTGQINFADLDLECELSSGTDKTVYEARWCGKSVAVVKVKKGACDTEAELLARLSKHPSLIRFYGKASDDEGHDYLVTELASQGSLDSVLEKLDAEGQTACLGVMMAIAHQICEGMEAVAAEGLIHRDLACRNVMVFGLNPADPSETDVKVCDFGLSRAGHTFYGGELAVPVRWMPPESLTHRRWSEKSDVWAFGVVLWEIFSNGCIPFAEIGSEREVGVQHKKRGFKGDR